MGKCVCMGAKISCSFGDSDGTLMILPMNMVNTVGNSAATIMDYVPMMNILPFGNCSSPSNPMVIAAYGAPQPCIPVVIAPWSPGSATVKIGKLAALDEDSTCMCMWAGSVSVGDAGQTDVSMDN